MSFEGIQWYCLIDTVKEWQTLIAGIFALLAAWVTVKVIRDQISVQKNQYDDSQKRNAWVARAELPDALSALCTFTERCTQYILAGTPADQMVPLPSEAIGKVKEAVGRVDPISAKRLFELTNHYQIHNARLFRGNNRVGGRNRDQLLYDVFFLRALINRLFEFARDKQDVIPDTEISFANMMTAYRTCVGLGEAIQREAEFNGVVDLMRQFHRDS